MKTWQEAIALSHAVRTGRVDEALGPMPIPFTYVGAAAWLALFIWEMHHQAVAHASAMDPVQTARQLTIVQTRCTELLEEVRTLRALQSAYNLNLTTSRP